MISSFLLLTVLPMLQFRGQHKTRKNRVWSMKAEFETCGVELLQVISYRILGDGELSPPTLRRTDYFYFQWSKKIPIDPFYDYHWKNKSY
jgi:hypothetical protein